MMRLPLAVISILLLSSSVVFTQTSSPIVTNVIADKAIAAFAQSPVQAVHLSGRAHGIAGSTDETGTFSLDLQGSGESKLDLKLATLSRTETSDALSDDPHCTFTKADGTQHDVAVHNCMQSLNWLVPALTLQNHVAELRAEPPAPGSPAGAGFAAAGVQVAGGAVGVQVTGDAVTSADTAAASFTRSNGHAKGKTAAMLEKLSAVTLKLDPATSLPASLEFNAHPEDDAGRDIPIVVRYADYRQVNGASLPFHIQKYVNNGLVLDLQVEDATVQ